MDHQTTAPDTVSSRRLASALRGVAESSVDGNTRGFMLAFVDNRGVGFNFLVRHMKFSGALYAVPSRGEYVPTYSCVSREGYDSDYSFVVEYLQAAASNMKVDYHQLVRYFEDRSSTWRFVPWEHGAAGRSRDNDNIWRTRLWPLIHHIVSDAPQCMSYLPENARAVLLRELRGHATEGMIVLER
jgi:hypothetical protein